MSSLEKGFNFSEILDKVIEVTKVLLSNPVSVGMGFVLLGMLVRMSRHTIQIETSSAMINGQKVVLTTKEYTTDNGFDYKFDLFPFEIPGIIPKETGEISLSDILIGSGIGISIAGAAGSAIKGISEGVKGFIP